MIEVIQKDGLEMNNIDFRVRMYEMSGKEKIEINEDTVFQKPIKVNKDYEANNMRELYELVETDVITSQRYENYIKKLQIGEIGIVKPRKKYKELYEEEKRARYYLIALNKELASAINEIESITYDEKILNIIAKIRR